MNNKNNFIEIGSGNEAIVWDIRFESLNDIDLILNDYESLGKEIKNNELVRILNELRNIKACVPSAESFYEAFNLIEGCVLVEQEVFDRDTPVSFLSRKINVEKSQIASLVTLINRAKLLFQELWERDGIPQLNAEFLENVEIKKRQKENEVSQKKKKLSEKHAVDFKSQVQSLLSAINKIFEKKTGLHHLHPYLINRDDGTALVLTVHTSYQKVRSELEKAVTAIIDTKHRVYEIEESSPAGSGYIPHFAGKMRLKEMGWEQNKSVLSHPKEDILKIANEMREKNIVSIIK